MKRILSITLVVMMLASGLHITLASHYCGGRLAQVKWSLHHDLADCGMEGEGDAHSAGQEWQTACCSNVVAMWGTDGHFNVSTPLDTHAISQTGTLFVVPELFWTDRMQSYTIASVFPPGHFQPSSVERTRLCVYRI